MKYGSFEFSNSSPDIKTDEALVEREVSSSKRSTAEKEKKIRGIALSSVIELESASRNDSEILKTETRSDQMKNLQKEVRSVSAKNSETRPKIHALKKETVRSIGQSSTQELLSASGNLMVDGKNLRLLFETNQIDHNGLAAIIRQHLRGGDVESTYSKVKLGEEAMRGRAIEMRHDDPAFISDDSSTDINKTRNQRIDMLRSQIISPELNHPDEPIESVKAESLAKKNYDQAKLALERRRNSTLIITATLAVIGIAVIGWLTLAK